MALEEVAEAQWLPPLLSSSPTWLQGFLYHEMPNLWRKKMTEERYNYLEGTIQKLPDFFIM